jgi:hypothetical protein
VRAPALWLSFCELVKVDGRYVIAFVAILLISFGVKMFFLSAPTAGANTLAAPTSMNVLQHSDHLHKNNLPRSS